MERSSQAFIIMWWKSWLSGYWLRLVYV